jgi:hypothetical protein
LLAVAARRPQPTQPGNIGEPITVVKLFRFRKTTPRLERLHELSLFVNLTPAELEIVDGLLHERTTSKAK